MGKVISPNKNTCITTKLALSILALLLVFFASGARILPDPSRMPQAAIQIISPGSGSLITSPALFLAHTQCGANGIIIISMIDKTGKVFTRQVIKNDCSSQDFIDLMVPLYFDVQEEKFPVMISLLIKDEYNRPVALSSVDVGISTLESAIVLAQTQPGFNIISPEEGSLVKSDVVRITAEITPVNNKPIIIEVIAPNKAVLGSIQIPVPENYVNNALQIDREIRLSEISKQTDARLVIRQRGTIIPSTAYLSSITFKIVP